MEFVICKENIFRLTTGHFACAAGNQQLRYRTDIFLIQYGLPDTTSARYQFNEILGSEIRAQWFYPEFKTSLFFKVTNGVYILLIPKCNFFDLSLQVRNRYGPETWFLQDDAADHTSRVALKNCFQNGLFGVEVTLKGHNEVLTWSHLAFSCEDI